MKILNLEIKNIRGIRELSISPNGKNIAIYGPNGSGKSSIIDAIDFLFSGDISRLTGEGTEGISLKKHGKHVASEKNEACVQATLLNEKNEKIQIKRKLANPSKLIYDETLKNQIDPLVETAERRQHILTRREILQYITSKAKDRYKAIEILFRLKNIDKTRIELQRLEKKTSEKVKEIEKSEIQIIDRINDNIGEEDYNEELLLEHINNRRKILNAPHINKIDSKILKNDIGIEFTDKNEPNLNIILSTVDNIRKLVQKKDEKLIKYIKELQELFNELDENLEESKKMKKYTLTKEGLSLLEEDGICPLCEKNWDYNTLKNKLKNRLEKLDEFKKIDTNIKDEIKNCNKFLKDILIQFEKLYSEIEFFKEKYDISILNSKIMNIQKLSQTFDDKNNLRNYIKQKSPENILEIKNILEILEEIETFSRDNLKEPDAKRTAWDNLTVLEENITQLENIQKHLTKCKNINHKANVINETFLKNQKEIMDNFYLKIEDRFNYLYDKLHDDEDGKINATISTKEGSNAGTKIEVSFNDAGKFPPHAVHSEGHQDTMGICIYLALSDLIDKNIFIMLDDVLMSVDMKHRKKFTILLKDEYPERQFIITTHDKIWTEYIKNEKLVKSNNIIELNKWTFEFGPLYNIKSKVFDKIDNHLENNDTQSAAASLRYYAEEFFREVAIKLEVPVKFKEDYMWGLGDFYQPVREEYKNYIKKAMKSAKSWNKEKDVEKLKEIEKHRKKVYDNVRKEEWIVNPNVHYNPWADFTKEEFIDVVDSYKELFEIYKCYKCETIIGLKKEGFTPTNISCNCNHINWNLKIK